MDLLPQGCWIDGLRALPLNDGVRLQPASTSPSATCQLDELTSRQHDCLRLAAEGLTSAAIGERMGISPRTVDEHLIAVCVVLGVRTRIQAVALLARRQRVEEHRTFRP